MFSRVTKTALGNFAMGTSLLLALCAQAAEVRQPLQTAVWQRIERDTSYFADTAVGDAVAALYVCDPYCEQVGSVLRAKPGSRAASFEERYFDPRGAKDFAKAPANQRVSTQFGGSKGTRFRRGRKLLASGAGPPESKGEEGTSETVAETTSETSGGSNSSSPGSDSSSSSNAPALSILESENLPPFPIRFGILFGGSFGMRKETTTANTQVERDAKLRPAGTFVLKARSPNIFDFRGGSVNGQMEFGFMTAPNEASNESALSRTSSTQALHLDFGFPWKHRRKTHWGVGPLLLIRQEVFDTNPTSARGFPSSVLFTAFGATGFYRSFDFKLYQSILGSVSDSAEYRGTAVSFSELGLITRGCQYFEGPLAGRWSICGKLHVASRSEKGSGSTLSPTLTQDPSYRYLLFDLGVEFGLLEFSI